VKLEYDPIFISDPNLHWVFTADTEITSSPIIGSNHEIYFGTNNGTMYSIDSETGNMIWSYDTGAPVNSTGALAEYGTDMDRLYIGNDNGDVYALSLSDGTPSWIYNSGSGVVSSLLYDSGVVYFGTVDGGILRVADTEPMMAAAQRDDVREITPIWSTFQGNNLRTGMQESAVISLNINYYSGWNIVGLPLYVEDASYGTLFSDAVTGTLYGYESSYYGSDVLEAGNGYWLVFYNDGSADISGEAIASLTISLSEGWNLIAGISSPVPVGSISDPGGIIVSGTIYGYSSSYYNAAAIEPGKGYWANASADGDVTFGEGLARSRPVFEDMTAGANRLTINGQDLYFGIDIPADKMMSYSLPPKPPSGAFDVRFKGNTKIRGENSEIEVMSPYETITISYDVVLDAGEYMHWVLSTGSGEEYILEQDGEITVSTEDTFTLERKAIIPISYALHQNYPNPFNPITTLRYDLPVYNHVSLTIYDLNGREINQIVNTSQPAGHHSVIWNSTDSFGKPVSAGIYLYQIRTAGFVQTRKMVLLK